MTTTPPIDELVKRLRTTPTILLMREAEAALETLAAQSAKDKERIKELEQENECFIEQLAARSEIQMHKDLQQVMEQHNCALASIAELEAQVAAFREAALRIDALAENSYSIAHDSWWKRVPLAAFDALMSALRKTETKDGE